MEQPVEQLELGPQITQGLRGSLEGVPLEPVTPPRIKVLRITGQLLLEIFKRNLAEPSLYTRCISPDIPEDAVVRNIFLDPREAPGCFLLAIESSTFEPVEYGTRYPELVATFHRLVD
jgi:hypothetical protein